MKWLQVFIQFFPVVMQLILAIEEAAKNTPGGIPGATKKAVVLDVLTSGAAHGGETIATDKLAGIGSLIDIVVGSLNKSGAFPKPATPPAA